MGMGLSCLSWFNEKMQGTTSAMPAMAMEVWFLSTSLSESVVGLLLLSLSFSHLPLSPAVPLPPIGVRLTSLTSFSATIHWDHISSSYPPVHVRSHPLLMNINDLFLDPQTYHVEYRLNLDSRRWLEQDVPSNPNSRTITGKYSGTIHSMVIIWSLLCCVQVFYRMPATW